MRPSSKEAKVGCFCLPLRFGRKKTANEGVQLARRTVPTSTPAAEPVEPQLAEERAKVARLEQENRRVKATADEVAEAKRKLEDEIRETKKLLEAREKEVADKDAGLQRLGKDKSEMEKKLVEQQSRVTRIQELSARLDEKDKLLMERTKELSAAQAFLTRVDAVSETEVVGMVKNLNTLISSASGALQDVWDQRDPIPGTLVEAPELEQTRDNFSSSMLEQIVRRNPVAVNLAIQMSLGYFIRRVTSGWGGGETAETLGKIYGMISTKENQTIASRWRSLTKRYTPRHEPLQGEDVKGDLARILIATGSFSDFPEAMESVENSAGGDIERIIKATLQLDDTIKTKIASCDMSVYIVAPGAIFDEGTMANEFEEDGKKEGGENRVVAGTTEVGLLKRSDNVEEVLRKPKVILEHDLVEPEGES